MPYFGVWRKGNPGGEFYWLAADDPDHAKNLVALNCGEASGGASNPNSYDCKPDETKTPPPRLIYRRFGGPLTVSGR